MTERNRGRWRMNAGPCDDTQRGASLRVSLATAVLFLCAVRLVSADDSAPRSPAAAVSREPSGHYVWTGKSWDLPAAMIRDFSVKEVVKDGKHHLEAGGSVPFAGGELVLEVRGARNVKVEVDPAVGKTTYLGLDFREPVTIDVLKDGTVCVDRSGVVVTDAANHAWQSDRTTIDGVGLCAFFPKDAPAPPTTSTPRGLPPEDARAGQAWVHPVTGKKMILVPTQYIQQKNAEALRSFAVNTTFNKHGSDRSVALARDAGEAKEFVTGFFMDETEVTKADYLRFVVATNAALPRSWKGARPSAEQSAAAVAVSYEEAIAYAAWAGLALPSRREYCAAAADGAGEYPWTRDRTIYQQDWSSPVGSNPKDVAPLGFRDIVGHVWEWGEDRYERDGHSFHLAFSLFPPFKEDSDDIAAWMVTANSDDPKDEMDAGFRCIDEFVAMSSLLKGALAGRDTALEPPPTASGRGLTSPVYCEVTIDNVTDSGSVVTVSNGQRVELKAGETTKINLLTGTYMVGVTGGAGGTLVVRVYRCHLDQENGSVRGASYTWKVSEALGVEVPIGTSSPAASKSDRYVRNGPPPFLGRWIEDTRTWVPGSLPSTEWIRDFASDGAVILTVPPGGGWHKMDGSPLTGEVGRFRWVEAAETEARRGLLLYFDPNADESKPPAKRMKWFMEAGNEDTLYLVDADDKKEAIYKKFRRL